MDFLKNWLMIFALISLMWIAAMIGGYLVTSLMSSDLGRVVLLIALIATVSATLAARMDK